MQTRKSSAERTSHSSDLLDTLDWAFNVASWHGPNLAGSIKGLCPEDAGWAPPGRKSIWQQTLHAAYWKQRVLNKLIGTTPFARSGSNWPKLPEDRTQASWKRDIELLHEIHRKLRTAVAAMLNDDRELDPKLRRLIAGIALHDVYHAGQIRLLRKMLKGSSAGT